MPQIENLPPVVQPQIRAQRGRSAETPASGRKPVGVPDLKSWGLGHQPPGGFLAPAPAPMARPDGADFPPPGGLSAVAPSVHAEYGASQPRVARSRRSKGFAIRMADGRETDAP